jgi:ferredoxin-NADP reductase
MAPFQTLTARLAASRPLSQFTKHLEFEVSGEKFGFVPGQWLSLKQTNPEGEEITRAYSIASAPNGNRFALCLNRVQDGFMSNYLCDLTPGSELQAQGPFGNFILKPPLRDTIFIATGTGIAPYRGMLEWLFAEPSRHLEKQFWLIYGNRTPADIYYHDEFQKLAALHPHFHYLPTLSRADANWTGLRGYVQDHVKPIAEGRTDMHAYVCGLEKMVTANRDLLKSLGWDRKSILYEKYD